MTRTETLTRASSPQVGDLFEGKTFAMEVVEVNRRFVLLLGKTHAALPSVEVVGGFTPMTHLPQKVHELTIPFYRWPLIATNTLNAGAHFTPAEAHE